jgi:hypothetical protein
VIGQLDIATYNVSAKYIIMPFVILKNKWQALFAIAKVVWLIFSSHLDPMLDYMTVWLIFNQHIEQIAGLHDGA